MTLTLSAQRKLPSTFSLCTSGANKLSVSLVWCDFPSFLLLPVGMPSICAQHFPAGGEFCLNLFLITVGSVLAFDQTRTDGSSGRGPHPDAAGRRRQQRNQPRGSGRNTSNSMEPQPPTPPSYWLYHHSFIMIPLVPSLLMEFMITSTFTRCLFQEVHADYGLSHDTCVYVNDGVFSCRQMV